MNQVSKGNVWRRQQPLICKFFTSGKCTRNPCAYLHDEKAVHDSLNHTKVLGKRSNDEPNMRRVRNRTFAQAPVKSCDTQKPLVKSCDPVSTQKSSDNQKVAVTQKDGSAQNPCALRKDDCSDKVLKICNDWINKSCVHGENCKYLHSWSSSNDIRLIAQLDGHQKAVTGIVLPSGSDKLFTTSEDGTIRTWNCHTGECVGVADLGSPVLSLENEGEWLFAGMTNLVKGWNIKTGTEVTLDAPGGQVLSLESSDKTLFGGLEDGSIFRWKLNSDETSFEGPAIVKGHTGAVVSLFWGRDRVYSGSLDKTVRVWDCESLVCILTLQKHSEEIMSVLCWDQYLFSSSLDKTLKAWAATEVGLEVVHTHIEEHGIIKLDGMKYEAKKPILLCSCKDNTLLLYDLPSFRERGRIFAKDEIVTIHVAIHIGGGLFFTGDKTGLVSVWKGTFS